MARGRPDIGPRAEQVIATGEATWDERLLLFLERRGFKEESYHTFSYSPIPDDRGGIGGMLCVVTEETERVIGERRLKTLRELAARTTEVARSAGDACQTAARTLLDNPYDLPFVLVYLLDGDGRTARLAGATRVLAVEPLAHRLEAAVRSGAEPAGDQGAAEADVVFEVSGSDAAVDTALRLAKPGSRVVLVGIPAGARTTFTAAPARRKGLTLVMSRRMGEVYPRAIDLAARGLVDLRPLVSAAFGLGEGRRPAGERDEAGEQRREQAVGEHAHRARAWGRAHPMAHRVLPAVIPYPPRPPCRSSTGSWSQGVPQRWMNAPLTGVRCSPRVRMPGIPTNR